MSLIYTGARGINYVLGPDGQLVVVGPPNQLRLPEVKQTEKSVAFIIILFVLGILGFPLLMLGFCLVCIGLSKLSTDPYHPVLPIGWVFFAVGAFLSFIFCIVQCCFNRKHDEQVEFYMHYPEGMQTASIFSAGVTQDTNNLYDELGAYQRFRLLRTDQNTPSDQTSNQLTNFLPSSGTIHDQREAHNSESQRPLLQPQGGLQCDHQHFSEGPAGAALRVNSGTLNLDVVRGRSEQQIGSSRDSQSPETSRNCSSESENVQSSGDGVINTTVTSAEGGPHQSHTSELTLDQLLSEMLEFSSSIDLETSNRRSSFPSKNISQPHQPFLR